METVQVSVRGEREETKEVEEVAAGMEMVQGSVRGERKEAKKNYKLFHPDDSVQSSRAGTLVTTKVPGAEVMRLDFLQHCLAIVSSHYKIVRVLIWGDGKQLMFCP